MSVKVTHFKPLSASYICVREASFMFIQVALRLLQLTNLCCKAFESNLEIIIIPNFSKLVILVQP